MTLNDSLFVPPQVMLHCCLYTDYKHIFVNVPLKLLSPEAFSTQNALNIVWRPGSARTRWESLQRSPERARSWI